MLIMHRSLHPTQRVFLMPNNSSSFGLPSTWQGEVREGFFSGLKSSLVRIRNVIPAYAGISLQRYENILRVHTC